VEWGGTTKKVSLRDLFEAKKEERNLPNNVQAGSRELPGQVAPLT